MSILKFFDQKSSFFLKGLYAITALAFIAYLFLLIENPQKSNTIKLSLKDHALDIEVADSPESWYKGLSYRKNLCYNCGMLFVFPEKAEHTFVMRNMNFPLDIVWIDEGKVVKIDENLSPEGDTPLKHYNGGQPIDAVLELNAGSAERYGIIVGSLLNYKL